MDYGDPNDPEISAVIAAWSPYQNIKDGTEYPALFLDAGKSDSRCPAWHVRKMAARIQPQNQGPHPHLILVRDGVGHDRQRGEEGTRVAGRVEQGGRRDIQKKK